MSELLPERLGCPKSGQALEDPSTSKSRKRQVSTILEWIQYFGIYIMVLTRKHPERIPDLLGYQSLIIKAHLEYDGDNWLAYDRRFCLSAAANYNIVWGHIDQTLWSLAFSGKAKTSRCKYCFSITHQSTECVWEPEYPTQPTPLFPQQHPPVYFNWKSTPGRCPVIGCTYDHICLYCASNPTVLDKRHKGIHCPQYQFKPPTQGQLASK